MVHVSGDGTSVYLAAAVRERGPASLSYNFFVLLGNFYFILFLASKSHDFVLLVTSRFTRLPHPLALFVHTVFSRSVQFLRAPRASESGSRLLPNNRSLYLS
jgi:hypothetical protein